MNILFIGFSAEGEHFSIAGKGDGAVFCGGLYVEKEGQGEKR